LEKYTICTKEFNRKEHKILVKEGEKHLWKKFHPHHYMTANKPLKDSLPAAATFFTYYWLLGGEEILIGCAGVLFQINVKQDSKRLTRVVILPEFQGLGFGSAVVNSVAEFYDDNGFKIYSATYHPRLGEYRENSKLWEGTHYNLREFKTNDNAEEYGMSGLRDGANMYRHSYKKQSNYSLLYNPLDYKKIKKEIDILEKNLTIENEIFYLELFKTYKKLSLVMGLLEPKKVKIQSLGVTDIDHIKSKEEHKRLFGNKRKVLSAAERKEAKSKMKSKG